VRLSKEPYPALLLARLQASGLVHSQVEHFYGVPLAGLLLGLLVATYMISTRKIKANPKQQNKQFLIKKATKLILVAFINYV
jgi:hypothetical protein